MGNGIFVFGCHTGTEDSKSKAVFPWPAHWVKEAESSADSQKAEVSLHKSSLILKDLCHIFSQ